MQISWLKRLRLRSRFPPRRLSTRSRRSALRTSSTCRTHTRRVSWPCSQDRKSTRNSSHSQISYAVFCLKKKKTIVRGMNEQPRVAPAANANSVLPFVRGSEIHVLSNHVDWIYARLPNNLRGSGPAESAEA